MGDLHGPELKVLAITSAHLRVVRAQLYTVAPDWEGGWEMECTCVPGDAELFDDLLVVPHTESH